MKTADVGFPTSANGRAIPFSADFESVRCDPPHTDRLENLSYVVRSSLWPDVRQAAFCSRAASAAVRAAISPSSPTGFSLKSVVRKTHAARYEPAGVGWLWS